MANASGPKVVQIKHFFGARKKIRPTTEHPKKQAPLAN
jgi:hypothetical protein